MADQKNQSGLLVAFGVLSTLIALVAFVGLVRYSSRADTSTQEATIGNEAPSVDTTIPSDTQGGADATPAGFTPIEGTGLTKTIWFRGTVSDPNGCNDLAQLEVKIKRSGHAAGRFDDNNYQYTTSTSSFTDCTGIGDVDASWEVSIDIANYIDATDLTSEFEAQNWTIQATATDQNFATGSLTTDIEVNSLAAFDIAPTSISYGTLALGATSAQQNITFSNTGNRGEDALAHAITNMTSSLAGYADIPSTNVHVSTTDAFAYADGDAIPLTDITIPIALYQQTNDLGVPPAADGHFLLKIPTTGVNGTYTNTILFTANPNPDYVQAGGGGPPP